MGQKYQCTPGSRERMQLHSPHLTQDEEEEEEETEEETGQKYRCTLDSREGMQLHNYSGGEREAQEKVDNHTPQTQKYPTEDPTAQAGTVKDGISSTELQVEESAGDNEEVPLAFESFLHRNGLIYSCVIQHGHRMYVDDSKERVNICRYYDIQSGLWLLLPLEWEMNIEFVKQCVKQIKDTLPGLSDQKEITAALRQCNYDPHEVMSIYLTIFGDSLFQSSSKAQSYSELNSFRNHLQKDRTIEDLKQKLNTKENELDKLFQKNSYLARDTQYLADMVQHLNQRVAELEADKQQAMEKIRALLSRRSTQVPAKVPPPKPSVDLSLLRQVGKLTRELNVSNKQLGATVRHVLVDLQNHFQQLRELVEKMTKAEQHRVAEQEELRSLYMKEALERKTLYNKLLELQGNIRVFCRCRGNTPSNSCLEVPSEQDVVVNQKGSKKKFNFDRVYSSTSTQDHIFEGTKPIITSCVDGYNVCILAYGQTGSGKTYTMMGPKDNPGVNVRSIRELLSICKKRENITYSLNVSMLEIYNDSLNDLLSKKPNSHLDIRTQGKSITVPGLTQVEVKTEDDILHVMETGEKNRKIASTKMNIESSRSHLILTLTVVGADGVSGVTTHGTLTLCDLAGSERISKTEAKGQRLVEAAAINKSLTALGQVFSALKCNAIHVPFRNSKLTHLLQPCLCGDAKACVFVNVNPDPSNTAETLSTLQFGSSIRQVALGKATQNITSAPQNKQEKQPGQPQNTQSSTKQEKPSSQPQNTQSSTKQEKPSSQPQNTASTKQDKQPTNSQPQNPPSTKQEKPPSQPQNPPSTKQEKPPSQPHNPSSVQQEKPPSQPHNPSSVKQEKAPSQPHNTASTKQEKQPGQPHNPSSVIKQEKQPSPPQNTSSTKQDK
ncbi:kinesin-like protein klp-3 [Engraulis encrasicolus]|uniref:kinesin-like protein klp-3 n=1 Tax=Engraulis encrasicolus TaxID=184585 RepID=UPI002FD470C9